MDEPLIPQERAEQAPAAQQTAEPGKNLPPRPGGNPAPMSNIPGQLQQAPVNAWGGRPNPQGQYAPQQGGPSSFYSPEAQAGGQWGNPQGSPPGQQTQWSQSGGTYPTSPPIQEQGPLQQGWGPVPPQGPVSPQGSVPPQIHRQEQIYVNQGAGRGWPPPPQPLNQPVQGRNAMPQAPQYQTPQTTPYFRGPANQGWQPVQQPTVQAPYAAPDWSVCRTLLDTQERKHRRKLFRSSCNQIGWTILSCLLLLTAIISMLTTVVLVFHLYPAGMGAGAWMETASFFFIESIAYILAFLIPTLLLLLLKRVPMSSVFPSERVSVPVAAATVAIGFGICILANFPAAWITAIFQRFGLSQEMPGYEVNQDILAQVLFFIGVAVIPPLVEEFLFRGAVLHLLRRGGDGFAIVLSAALFALLHGNFIQAVFAFICGLVLAYTVVRTGNIWLAIIIHFLNNSWSVVNQILYSSGLETAADLVYSVCLFVIPVLGVVGIIFLAVKGKLLLPTSGQKTGVMPVSDRLNAFLFNPGMIVFLAYSIFSCVSMLVYTTG